MSAPLLPVVQARCIGLLCAVACIASCGGRNSCDARAELERELIGTKKESLDELLEDLSSRTATCEDPSEIHRIRHYAYIRLQRTDEAIAAIEEFAKTRAPEFDELKSIAMTLVAERRFAESIRYFQIARRPEESDAEFVLAYAEASCQIGMRRQCRDAAREVLQLTGNPASEEGVVKYDEYLVESATRLLEASQERD